MLFDDDAPMQLKKLLLLASSAMMALLAIAWGTIFLYFDEKLAGMIPTACSLFSFASMQCSP